MLSKLLGAVKWTPTLLASVLGAAQVIIKIVKELLTFLLNLAGLLILLFPGMDRVKYEAVIRSVRDWVNVVDGWVEKLKSFLL